MYISFNPKGLNLVCLILRIVTNHPATSVVLQNRQLVLKLRDLKSLNPIWGGGHLASTWLFYYLITG